MGVNSLPKTVANKPVHLSRAKSITRFGDRYAVAKFSKFRLSL